MYNIYRRISQLTSHGTEVLKRKTRKNGNEVDAKMVGEWFKKITKDLESTNDVRTITTTAFSIEISLITENGENLIYEYWAEATK